MLFYILVSCAFLKWINPNIIYYTYHLFTAVYNGILKNYVWEKRCMFLTRFELTPSSVVGLNPHEKAFPNSKIWLVIYLTEGPSTAEGP